jgi:steroid Delta-isomerase
MSEALHRYAAFFGRLQQSDLARLDEIFAADARFKDPFNDVRGVPAIRAIFAHMYATCVGPHFVVLETSGSDELGWLRWRFEFSARGLGETCIEGVSRVRFDAHGRATEHIDYWDASELFEAIPVLGALLRGLRRRFSATC